MRKRRNWIKSTIAMVVLVATVLNTGFSTLAADIGMQDGEAIPVENLIDDADSSVAESTEAEASEDITVETVAEESDVNDADTEASESVDADVQGDSEQNQTSESNSDIDIEIVADDGNASDDSMPVDEEIGEVETDEAVIESEIQDVEKSLSIDDNRIVGEGYSDLQINVDAEELSRLVYFGIKVYTGADAYYDGAPIEDSYIASLSEYTDNVYISNLENKSFEIVPVGESENDIIFEMSVDSVENGTISLKAYTGEVDESERRLEASENTISGAGYDSITVSFEYNNASDDADSLSSYNIDISSESDEVTLNGNDVSDSTFDINTDTVVIEGLAAKSFNIAVKPIDSDDAKVAYDVTSVEDGDVLVTIDFTGEADTKTTYKYEDSKVKVTATLEYATAVPDDAEFVVTEVTPDADGYNYDAYMEALNKKASNLGEEPEVYTEDNTLLYDVAFFVTDEEGNRSEYQPEDGSVSIMIEFKKNQLEDMAGTEEVVDTWADYASGETATFIHLPLSDSVKEATDSTQDATDISASDIRVEIVAQDVAVTNEEVTFELNDFSVIAAHINDKDVEIKAEPLRDYKDILGGAVNYGVTANDITFTGHCDTNFAAGSLHGGSQLTQGKYTGSGNPGNDIIGAYDGSGWWADATKDYKITTTPDVASILRQNSNITSRSNIHIDDAHTTSELQNKVSGYVSGTLSSTLYSEKNYNDFSTIAHKYASNDYRIEVLLELLKRMKTL